MVYFFFQKFFRIIFKLFFFYQVTGHENIPSTKPIVIISNHISNWDPLLVGSSVDRQVHFMAKESLFRTPVVGSLVRAWGAFPVKRGAGDRTAIRTAVKMLEENKVIGIFPEGHRSRNGRLGEFYPGAVSFALKGDAVTIPMVIQGPYRLFRRIKVRIGTPVDLTAFKAEKINSATLEQAAIHLRSKVAELLEEKL